MQFRDLGRQYQALKKDIDAGISQVINSSRFIFGPQVEQLESELAEYVGVKHCISCANGTDALILVLKAWGIGEGDAVFAPDFTFFATVNCAMGLGAEAVLTDIDGRTFNMCPDSLEKAILRTIEEGRLTPKVIIPVDLFGQCADYEKILAIAKKYGLRVLEDGAQGFGGSINGRLACSFGDAATTSFFPAKPLGCYGDGGAIFTNDDGLCEVLRSIRAQGRSPEDKYDNRQTGLNSRLDTLQAAILLPKFKAFRDYEIDEVNRAADTYTSLLKDAVVTPLVPKNYVSSWAQYTVLLKDRATRDALQQHLRSKNIPSMIYYPKGMHSQTAVMDAGYDKGDFCNTERVAATCLSLPMHPYLTNEEIGIVAKEVLNFLNR